MLCVPATRRCTVLHLLYLESELMKVLSDGVLMRSLHRNRRHCRFPLLLCKLLSVFPVGQEWGSEGYWAHHFLSSPEDMCSFLKLILESEEGGGDDKEREGVWEKERDMRETLVGCLSYVP